MPRRSNSVACRQPPTQFCGRPVPEAVRLDSARRAGPTPQRGAGSRAGLVTRTRSAPPLLQPEGLGCGGFEPRDAVPVTPCRSTVTADHWSAPPAPSRTPSSTGAAGAVGAGAAGVGAGGDDSRSLSDSETSTEWATLALPSPPASIAAPSPPPKTVTAGGRRLQEAALRSQLFLRTPRGPRPRHRGCGYPLPGCRSHEFRPRGRRETARRRSRASRRRARGESPMAGRASPSSASLGTGRATPPSPAAAGVPPPAEARRTPASTLTRIAPSWWAATTSPESSPIAPSRSTSGSR